MDTKEIEKAAYKASKLTGAERINFIMQFYPNDKYHWGDILNIADRLRKEERQEFICKYIKL